LRLPRPLFAILLVLLGVPTFSLEIKLASVAPEQSPWGAALNQMALDWQRISGGEVRLRVYHNAIAGEESDVLRKMRIGQLQAAVLTSAGMKQVVPEVFSVSVPFMIRSREILSAVMDEIRPDLESEFDRNRLHVLAWTRAGWIHFFSRDPVTYPEDLKPQRLAADPNDEELLQAFRIMGYRPIAMPQPELLQSLNSGLVDAFYTSPLVAASYQWFALAPNMLDLRVAPFLGAIVITDTAWRRVPSGIRDQLLESAQAIADQIEAEVLELEEEAVTMMQQYGLHVQEVSPETEQRWIDDVSRYDRAMLDVFDPVMTQRIRGILADRED
jgi:TRAP-type C4-dicarboxylate transport system substrate-binding protein